jgi:hypothetical protein
VDEALDERQLLVRGTLVFQERFNRLTASAINLTSLLLLLLYYHQQPEVNYLPRFGPQLISLEE